MRNGNKIDRQQDWVPEDPSNHQIEHEAERDSVQNVKLHEANRFINEIDHEKEFGTVIKVKNEGLENILNKILQFLEHCTMLGMYPKEKLPNSNSLLILKKVLV